MWVQGCVTPSAVQVEKIELELKKIDITYRGNEVFQLLTWIDYRGAEYEEVVPMAYVICVGTKTKILLKR